jgi:hypothetical protein
MEDGTAIRDSGYPSCAVVGDVIKCRAKPANINFGSAECRPSARERGAPKTCCIAGEMPSALIAAAEVAAVTTGSIAGLTEIVTDIDVLSKYAVRRSNI